MCLSSKVAAFLLVVAALHDVGWIMKVDDAVYLAPLRVLPVLRQWDRIGADHTACFRHGNVPAAAGAGGEPSAFLLGARYPLHAYRAIFAVRGMTVREVLVPNHRALREFSSDGAPLALWPLARTRPWLVASARVKPQHIPRSCVRWEVCRGGAGPVAARVQRDILRGHPPVRPALPPRRRCVPPPLLRWPM